MKISAKVAIPIILLAVLLVGGIGYFQVREVLEVPNQVATPLISVVDPKLPYRTEEAWTVLQISQFLSDFNSLVHGKPLESIQFKALEGLGSYEVRTSGKSAVINVESGVWKPATYQALTNPFSRKPDLALPDSDFTELARVLLSSNEEVFIKQGARVSEFLQAHPASAAGHLQAALLLGVIAMNDYAGDFRDVRIPLNRMIAHLTAADALGAVGNNPDRQFLEILRLTLIGQQAAALSQMAAWKPTDAAFEDWREMIRLRNTADWREGRQKALIGSPALKREYFNALTRSINANAGLEFLREAKIEPDAALWRIANQSTLSVSGGHVFTKPLFDIEISESADAAKAFGIEPTKDNLQWLREYLDTPEGSPVIAVDGKLKVDVAGRNLFAGYNQRHFMQGLNQLYSFLNDRWGVRDQAAEVKEFIQRGLPDMRYKPFLIRSLARANPERIEANKRCVEVIREHPEMVVPALWSGLRNDQNGEDLHLPFPDFHGWFHPEVPAGTAFESGSRLYEIGVGDENNDAWMKTLLDRAPYSYALAYQNAYLENGRSGPNLSREILGKWVGPLADYDLNVMGRLARCDQGQPALYEEAMTRAAQLDGNYYLILGDYLVKNKLPDQAARAYLKGFEVAPDRVWMANSSKWLVKYLFEKDGIDMANKVAAEAAEVYSYDGLEAFVWLKEKEGKWDEALETAKKIDERYEDGEPVSELSCLIRMSESQPEKANTLGYQEKVKKVFPEGIQKVAFSTFSDPPKRGASFNGSTPAMVPFGLKKGTVVVALNGYRTDTLDQYTAIRALSDDPKMSLIVWQDGRYRLSEGELKDRVFGVDMGDYVQD